MGSEFVQDPSWGNWASGLVKSIQGSTGTALHNAATVESILAAREKRARDTEMWNTGKDAAGQLDAATPAAKVDPSFRDVTVENQGPVNPADPTTQPGEIFLPPTIATESFIDPRALAAAQARRNLMVTSGRAAILKDPSSAPAQAAQAEVAAAGVPRDPRDRARLQFGTTGRFPTSDETKLQGATNFTVYQNGQSTGRQFATRDGRTTLEGRPIASMYDPTKGETALESGAASMAQPNPIESAPIAQNNFNQMAAKILAKVDAGLPLSNDELNAARATRDAGWQKKIRFFKDPETEQEILAAALRHRAAADRPGRPPVRSARQDRQRADVADHCDNRHRRGTRNCGSARGRCGRCGARTSDRRRRLGRPAGPGAAAVGRRDNANRRRQPAAGGRQLPEEPGHPLLRECQDRLRDLHRQPANEQPDLRPVADRRREQDPRPAVSGPRRRSRERPQDRRHHG